MDYISSELQRDFDRWDKMLDAQDPCDSRDTIGVRDVLRAHYLIADYFYHEGEGIGGLGPKSLGMLQSAVGRQLAGYGGKLKWKEPMQKCATLFFGLIKNHPFHDANKRTAFLTLLYHLEKIRRIPSSPRKVFEELAIRTASNTLDKYSVFSRFQSKADAEIWFLADFIRTNTRKQDKRRYTVTYRQLDTLLQEFGYRLGNPSGNYIDIICEKEKTSRKGLKLHTRTEQISIGKIGFPGWTREASHEDVMAARRLTGLMPDNPEKPIDSQMFFKGADSLEVLIDQYRDLLKRLSDK